jgi:general secretion pathway protein L
MNRASLFKSIRAIGDSGTSTVRRAWGWWSSEMIAMMPNGARQALNDHKQTLVVSLGDGYANVNLHQGEQTQRVATFAMHPESADETQKIRSTIDELMPSITTSIVQLPEKSALQRNITLPLETEEKLTNVLGFEMDRLTPFTGDEVYFDYSVLNRNKAKRTIDLKFTVAKKDIVEEVVDTLADYGVRPAALIVSDEPFDPRQNDETDAAHNLLPHERRVSPFRQKRYLPYFLSALVTLLAAIAVLLPLHHLNGVRAELDTMIAEARSAAMAAEQTRNDIERVIQQGRFFASRRAEFPSVVQILDEITRVLPDDTVLLRFEVVGTRLKFQGESTSASSLISLIEGMELFHRASFTSPVTKNPRTNRDRFTLEAEIITTGDDT